MISKQLQQGVAKIIGTHSRDQNDLLPGAGCE
jgi:hypothetical protein